jgi:hypothetical protein
MINVTNRANVAMRLRTFKFLFRHDSVLRSVGRCTGKTRYPKLCASAGVRLISGARRLKPWSG